MNLDNTNPNKASPNKTNLSKTTNNPAKTIPHAANSLMNGLLAGGYGFVLSFFVLVLMGVGLVGCGENAPNIPIKTHTSSHNTSDDNTPKTPTKAPIRTDKPIGINQPSPIHQCPRIIQQNVDNAPIVADNILTSSYCDYYIYPQKGQTIEVILKGDGVKAELLRPDTHDFNNGAYQVTQTGRHTLRVHYDGVQVQPKNLSYTLVLTIR